MRLETQAHQAGRLLQHSNLEFHSGKVLTVQYCSFFRFFFKSGPHCTSYQERFVQQPNIPRAVVPIAQTLPGNPANVKVTLWCPKPSQATDAAHR